MKGKLTLLKETNLDKLYFTGDMHVISNKQRLKKNLKKYKLEKM